MSTAEEAAGGNGSRRPGDGEKLAPLLAPDEAEDVGARWQSIQAGFVDHPRQSVHEADALVTDLMERLTRTFADERATLEEQWSERDGEASTEELRVALQRYRSFFERLISV